MNWVAILLLVEASAAIVLALLHLSTWSMDRTARAHLPLASVAITAAIVIVAEIQMISAPTPAEFALSMRTLHLSLLFALAASLWLVRFYIRSGRPWLAGIVCAALGIALILHFIYTPAFAQLAALRSLDPRSPLSFPHLSLAFLVALSAVGWELCAEAGRSADLAKSLDKTTGDLSDRSRALCLALLEKNEADRSRQESEAIFRQVFESAPSALVMFNPEGRITLANARTEALFGYAHEELMERNVDALIPERFRARDAAELPDRLPSARLPHRDDPSEWFGHRKDGSKIPIDVSLTPVASAGGVSILASITDHTLPRNNELDHLRQELAHLSRVAMLGELSGSLAHELNQPLTSILSNAQAAREFLRQGPAGIAEVGGILEDIVKEDRRAGEVIRRLRGLFRNGDVHYESIDLNELVLEIVKLMNSELINHDASVFTDLCHGSPVINGDRVQLQQVLINLMLNACDAMADLPAHERKLVVNTLFVDDGRIELRVIDSGPGIPAGDSERIFQPFYTTKAHGMGLGLAVCRTIITAHQARLWASNNPGGGARFHVRFPSFKEVKS